MCSRARHLECQHVWESKAIVLIKLRSETVNKVPHVYVCVCARAVFVSGSVLWVFGMHYHKAVVLCITFPVDEVFNCEPVIIMFMFKSIFFTENIFKGICMV